MVLVVGHTKDNEGKTILVDKEGRIISGDIDNTQLLSDILKELKKMNLQLQIITDITVNNEEVD